MVNTLLLAFGHKQTFVYGSEDVVFPNSASVNCSAWLKENAMTKYIGFLEKKPPGTSDGTLGDNQGDCLHARAQTRA